MSDYEHVETDDEILNQELDFVKRDQPSLCVPINWDENIIVPVSPISPFYKLRNPGYPPKRYDTSSVSSVSSDDDCSHQIAPNTAKKNGMLSRIFKWIVKLFASRIQKLRRRQETIIPYLPV